MKKAKKNKKKIDAEREKFTNNKERINIGMILRLRRKLILQWIQLIEMSIDSIPNMKF